jgi:two-component system heavy metal sensor histidine kinase CusS
VRRPRLNIRWRLTLWYGAVLSAILVAFSGSVYLLMRHHLLAITDAGLRGEFTEFQDEVRRTGDLSGLAPALQSRFSRVEGHEFELSTTSGEPLFRSVGVAATGLPRPVVGPPGTVDPTIINVTLDGLGPVHLAGGVVDGPGGPLLAHVAASLAPSARALRELVIVFLTIGPMALACTLGGGYWLARKALGPIDRMAATAAEITSSRLDRRLEGAGAQDELGGLARTFNAMIERLQRSFEEVRRFTADAAHELRTPLAAMRTEAEVALRSPRSPERDGRVLEDLLEEMERLTRLVSQLLFLCREDAGLGAGDIRPVRLDHLVCEVGEHMQVAAQEKGVGLHLDLPGHCPVRGDADRLRQLFFNLLDNAIKYTPPGGTVAVRGESTDGQVRVTVADTGIGISADHLPHVFDRFYRVDPSRSPEAEGSGLGLAICRSIAEAHGGRLGIDSDLGSGTRVTLVLPARREEDLTCGPSHADWLRPTWHDS